MSPDIQTIPLFPLPNLVFFPNTLLPLHVFEPRYKEMIADALESDRMVGIVQLRPGWEKDYYGNPPIYKVLGVGQIVHEEQLDDGRYDILVEGLYRGHVINEYARGEYRVADVELMQDYVPLEHQGEVDRLYPPLVKILQQIATNLPELAQTIRPEALADPTPAILSDLLSFAFMDNAYDKQSILSELDVSRRLQLVKVQMKTILRQK